MPRPINFITVESESYTRIITSIVDPIRKFLPDSLVSDRLALKDAVNVHFLMKKEYRSEVAHCGINVSMFHGIADKQIRTGSKSAFMIMSLFRGRYEPYYLHQPILNPVLLILHSRNFLTAFLHIFISVFLCTPMIRFILNQPWKSLWQQT